MSALRSTLAVLAALLLLPVAAEAQAPQTRSFVMVDASVNHEIEWHAIDSATPGASCSSYTESSGVQRAVAGMVDRDVPMQLQIVGKNAALQTTELVRYSGQVTRTFDERFNPPSCGACGGELGECGGQPAPPPAERTYDCARQKLVAPGIYVLLHPKGADAPEDDLLGPSRGDFVRVEFASSAAGFRNCPPTYPGGPGLPAVVVGDPGITFTGSQLQAIMKAKPGRTIHLKGQRQIGWKGPYGGGSGGDIPDGCPALTGPGLQVCETFAVDVTLKRVR